MDIRPENDDEHDVVLDIVRQAFGREGAVVAELVDALRRDDPDAVSLVAVEAGEVAGHVMFSRSLLDAPRQLVDVQVLSPLAVRPAYQHKGLGRELIRDGLARMDAQGVPLVFLEGDPGYYPRSGFAPGGDLGFRKPSLRIPDAAFQVVRLAAYEPWMTGTLVYSSTFWDLDCVGLRDPAA
ncbi:N-acetyltransferase [Winogradskya consettensis]|uniref:N-acetyltransferase n=1 Tax=Winogradskya consettensis TaxID=113560 RepID=A0A919T0W8_9ACTN|nr:N-acetyltransferase [Actinoplanes consettensis]GIM83704.1 N-acetyltransferase [Actinoplanes consettensis]